MKPVVAGVTRCVVTFVSLFLWLMNGVHTVEVAVDPAVAKVEIYLDQRRVGIATAPDWSLECDFGPTLRPHELEAVALDETGAELGRARQLVNMPRGNAEVEIVLEGDGADAPEALRVVAISRHRHDPLAVFVTFDGVALRQRPDGRFELPDYDPRMAHVVSAEAHFPNEVMARKDIIFGGVYGGRVTTELTAVPVVVDGGRRPDAAELEGLLSVRTSPVRVAAVERPGGRVYAVRDHVSWPVMRGIGDTIDVRQRKVRADIRRRLQTGFDLETERDLPPKVDRFYLVVANPIETRGLSLFPVIRPFDLRQWGLQWLLTHVSSEDASVSGQMLAEAVAVAGVRAAAEGTPRTVVIVVSGESDDRSRLAPGAARQYLEALRVPLEVWSSDGSSVVEGWGAATDVSKIGALGKASRRLVKQLERQWIVWIEGRHLPPNIELAPNARGLDLAGAAASGQ
jgi:hypothetical protein